MFAPLAQRRQLDYGDVQSVVEVGTKTVLLDELTQVLLRRCDHTAIDRHSSFEPSRSTFLQHYLEGDEVPRPTRCVTSASTVDTFISIAWPHRLHTIVASMASATKCLSTLPHLHLDNALTRLLPAVCRRTRCMFPPWKASLANEDGPDSRVANQGENQKVSAPVVRLLLRAPSRLIYVNVQTGQEASFHPLI